jgi:C4-type Zn-finger protein
MTRGNHYDLPCPHCGMYNHDHCKNGRWPEHGKVLMFAHECRHCKQPFYVTAVWEIVTRAERIDPRGAERPEAGS